MEPSCTWFIKKQYHIDGLVQDCSNPSANALELLQSCTKPSTYDLTNIRYKSDLCVRTVFCQNFGPKWSCYEEVQLCSAMICQWFYPWDYKSITAYCYIWKIHEGSFRKVRDPFVFKLHHLMAFVIRIHRNIQSTHHHYLFWTNAIISLPSWEMKH